jgi:hypothetical protein
MATGEKELEVMIDIEGQLSKLSILITEGVHIGARALLII